MLPELVLASESLGGALANRLFSKNPIPDPENAFSHA